MVDNRLKIIQNWLFPGNCLLCVAPLPAGTDLCAPCAAALPRPAATCPRCAATLAVATAQPCGACQRRPPAFDSAVAALRYAPPVDRLIQDLKYHRRLALARVLGTHLATHLATGGNMPDLVLPVPLHPARLRRRGYNQSLEIARVVAHRLRLPLVAQGVVRVRATTPQARLDPAARRRNVRNAFRAEVDFSGRRVAVVDDVMTSGHTVNALAKCLKRAGAAEVAVWVVARAG